MKLITFPSESLSKHMIFPSSDNSTTIALVATVIPSRSAVHDAMTIFVKADCKHNNTI
jgi:hypothetical protein